MDALCRRTAVELAGLIRVGDVSSREVVEAHLARIDEVNDYVNAVTLILRESALEAADAADRADAAERARPFHGVPFTIKENIDFLGTPTTDGLPSRADAMPRQDAPIVERMKRAGAVPLARTNLPEMGSRLDTDNPLRGRTRNPWNGALTPGGSSGGEGAALATGMTPFGLGNDIGGSLRNPAYCCGIASLKPSLGRIPFVLSIDPVDMGLSAALLTDGPMARSVGDLRQGLAILAGRHPDDPQSVDTPLEGPVPNPRRAALVTEVPGCELPAATTAEIRRAGALLADQGWRVEEVEAPELERVTEIWGKILMGEGGFEESEGLLSPPVHRYMLSLQELLGAPKLPLALVHSERRRLRRRWSAFLTEHTVAIGPTWTQLPWPIDSDLEPDSGAQLLVDTVGFITPGNVLGLPAVALPTGVSDGLPTGVQVYADLYREDLCLLAAEAIERGCTTPTPIDPVR